MNENPAGGTQSGQATLGKYLGRPVAQVGSDVPGSNRDSNKAKPQ